jgi:hypothetical protein
VFILGDDYHLGDLLWFTSVLAEYRKKLSPSRVVVAVPDRAISRILEHNPLADELLFGAEERSRILEMHRDADNVVVHDLRVFPIALAMLRQWRRRRPWLYYRDLWMRPRGQWLATYLRLGELEDPRPAIQLTDADRAAVRDMPGRFVVLAPHIGQYAIPFTGMLWRRVKSWPTERWVSIADNLRSRGYEPYSLGATGQPPVPGTTGIVGLPIRQVAAIVEGASALITVESGLWFVAAALNVPFIIVPWWLPRSIDWPGSSGVAHARIYRGHDSVGDVAAEFGRLVRQRSARGITQVAR